MPVVASTILLVLLASPAFEPAEESFPLTTFKSFQRFRGLPEDPQQIIHDPSLPGLSVVVRYMGHERAIRGHKRWVLEAVGESARLRDPINVYNLEIQVEEQGRLYWIPIRDTVLESFRAQVQPGDETTLQMRYLGAFGHTGRLYVAIGFGEVMRRISPMTCFSDEVVGVRVGDPYEVTRAKLVDRLGEPFRMFAQGQQHYDAFVLDPDHRTVFVIADAGAGYRERVYSIQVIGPANPDLALLGPLRLGSTAEEVERVLGAPTDSRPSGDGYTRLTYENTNCSVELKEGTLASFLIAADPHYFEE